MKLLALALFTILLSGCNAVPKSASPDLLFIEPTNISGDALVAQSYFLLAKEAHRLEDLDYEFELLNELSDHQYGPAQLEIAEKLLKGQGKQYVDGDALSWVQKAIDNNHIPAILYLAKWYQYGGNGVEVDLKKSMELYAKAIELGEPSAATELGYIFLDHWRTDKGYETAKQLLANAAYYGEAKALCGLGRVYQDASLLRDITKAAEYFEVSYIRGYKLCAFELGYLHHKITNDLTRAYSWYKRAASSGSADALNNLGLMYNQGEGVEVNLKKARAYFEQATELGSHLSFGNLGRLYEFGEGVVQSFEQAAKYYERGIELGDAQSMHNMGSLYNKGSGVEQNRDKALELFELAAQQGNQFSAFNLGNAYLYGNGKEQNSKLAFEYYVKSAKFGFSPAYCQAADVIISEDWQKAKSYYYEGAKLGQGDCAEKLTNYMRIRQERDLPIITLLISLATRGVAVAHRELGVIYHYGDFGEAVNFEKAKNYYLEAGKLGEGLAYANLGYLYEEGEHVGQDIQMAASLYVKSVELGNALGQNNLGTFYLNGVVFEKNIDRAIDLYEQAVRGGNVFAMMNLADVYSNYASHQNQNRACELYKSAFELDYQGAITKYSHCVFELESNPEGAYKILESGAQKGCQLCVVKQVELALEGHVKNKPLSFVIQTLESASTKGNANASLKLAELYESGEYVSQSYEKALYWFERAVANGQLDALNKVAQYYWDGKGTEHDEQRAINAISQLAEAQNYNVASFVGEHYYYGVNVDEDVGKARQYFLQAAQQDDDIALNNLGVIYRDGLRVEVDTDRALTYFKRSAELGLPDAMHNLGALNLKLNQDLKGLAWLLKAAKQNHSESYVLLGAYYANQKADRDAQKKAVKWLQLAADDNLPEGMYQLAMLLKQQNSNKLTAEATKWLEAAASSGHQRAKNELSDKNTDFKYEK
ncbi:tetratricopeptide repeat protein [Pseudoalteromonas luteoviolacea]|uniref:tetratricopeptide repeat protein n=1 Tax=Pseudoalteromonas luteoviolacea TaxID=43657 RepID=UPI0011512F7C|nr:tetratricopeptide repeat protein [Pseudoalteromonas luteoviolacea]TQF67552.1 sel1 repeat family protein [Pseudoalteromonas luteoviolacea]